MKVVFNADDFGLHPNVSLGIIHAVERGVVRSTSVLASMVSEDELKSLKRLEQLGASYGVHLTLTSGKPLSNFPAELLAEDGSFDKSVVFSPFSMPRLSREIVLKELSAQVEVLLPYGPSHLDTHHHIHAFGVVLDAIVSLAKTFGLAVRALNKDMRAYLKAQNIRCCDVFIDSFFGKNNLTVEKLMFLLDKASSEGAQKVEVMCHPGYVNEIPPTLSSYLSQRETELSVLTSDQLMRELATKGYQLINYAAV